MTHNVPQKKILVTGANGFIGRNLCRILTESGFHVCAVTRTALAEIPNNEPIGEINGNTDWSGLLDHVDVVVHLAARVHVMKETAADSIEDFLRVNLEGTRKLAQDAIAGGVKHFIFISSIKVNGESTSDTPFRATDCPRPKDAYAQSKYEAEEMLQDISDASDLPVTVIRPPLVYGPGVKGNMLRLIRLIKAGVPLPFGSVNNKRSLVSVYNLIDLIVFCIENENSKGRVLMVSDGQDLSTPELIERLSDELGVASRMFRFPVGVLSWLASLVGKRGELEKLLVSLQADISLEAKQIGWRPPFEVGYGIRKMVGR